MPATEDEKREWTNLVCRYMPDAIGELLAAQEKVVVLAGALMDHKGPITAPLLAELRDALEEAAELRQRMP